MRPIPRRTLIEAGLIDHAGQPIEAGAGQLSSTDPAGSPA
jgi:hypothetical protein